MPAIPGAEKQPLPGSPTNPSSPLGSPKNHQIYERHGQLLRSFNDQLEQKLHINIVELFFLLAYPLIVITGQIVYWLNSFFLTENKALQDQTQSDILVYDNYFTQKKNLVNIFFVKKGWGWTSVVFLTILYKYAVIGYQKSKNAINSATSSPEKVENVQNGAIKSIAMLIGRFLAATTWWIFFTQWFFGKPLMDKVFIATGGKCTDIDSDSNKLVKYIARNPDLQSFLKKIEEETGSYLAPGPVIQNDDSPVKIDTGSLQYEAQISSAVCRKIGGKWAGGHDPSGHCFLLTHSSLFIVFEILPFARPLLKDLYSNNRLFYQLMHTSETLTLLVRSYLKPILSTEEYEKDIPLPVTKDSQIVQFARAVVHPLVAALLLVALWAWTLLITAIYFHSLPELLAGSLAGYFEIALVYILPRFSSL